MKHKRVKIQDHSIMTRTGYVFGHIVYGIIFAGGFLAYISSMLPFTFSIVSIVKLAICLILVSLIGIALSFRYNRTDEGIMYDVVTGMGFYTVLALGHYLPKIVMALLFAVIVFSGIGMILIACEKIRRKAMREKVMLIRIMRSIQLIRRNISYAAIAAMIGLPIGVRMIYVDYKQPVVKVSTEGNNVAEIPGLIANEFYGDDYKMENILDTIRPIRNDTEFQALSYEEKCDVLRMVIYCEAHHLGLGEVHVKFEEIEENYEDIFSSGGQFDFDSRTITINSEMVRNDGTKYDPAVCTNQRLLTVCIHEARHYYQHLLANLYIYATPEQRSLLVFTENNIKSWAENLYGYFSDIKDMESFETYENQPVEIDARLYAIERLETYLTILDSY